MGSAVVETSQAEPTQVIRKVSSGLLVKIIFISAKDDWLWFSFQELFDGLSHLA